MAIPDWLTIASTVASPLVSAAGAIVSWRVYSRQTTDSKEKMRALQAALAPTLLGDVDLAISSLQEIMDRCGRFKKLSMANSSEAMLVMRGLGGIRMPAVESFREQIASFNGKVADAVLQASACLDRVHHVVEGFLNQHPNIADLASAVAAAQISSPNAMDKLQAARRALLVVIAANRN